MSNNTAGSLYIIAAMVRLITLRTPIICVLIDQAQWRWGKNEMTFESIAIGYLPTVPQNTVFSSDLLSPSLANNPDSLDDASNLVHQFGPSSPRGSRKRLTAFP